MHPIEAFVRHPVKVWVGVLLVVLFGTTALMRMPMQLTPEVQVPTLSIETRWPGASPQEVEREILQEQEEQLKAVEGVIKMTSEAADSVGRITLEFAVGTNMREALLKVNSRLQQVPEYPPDADEPVISTSSASDAPIAWFILSVRPPAAQELEAAERTYPHLRRELAEIRAGLDHPGLAARRLAQLAAEHPELAELLPPDTAVGTLRKFAEDVIEAALERVPGVSNANVIGGVDPELQVIVDPEKLAARQLTIAQVRDRLRAQNRDVSAGDIWEGKRRYVVRTLHQFRSPEDVAGQILATSDGAPVYVRDVAEVVLAYKKPVGLVRRYGRECIAVNVIRDTGANVLDVMAGLRQEVRRLNEGILRQRGLLLSQVYDETEYIYSAIDLVKDNIFTGSALTMIVLMLFLHRERRTLLVAPLVGASALAAVTISPWFFALTVGLILAAGFWFARGAVVIALAIPVSIVGTFLFLDAWGRSLNVISLAGLAFAVGMLVDNAVVVLENIYRHHEEGAPPLVAAERATKEVWGAVLASTLTTLAVFLPVLSIQEEAGQLFGDIALAISAAIGLSLAVAITLIPTVAARLLRRSETDSPAPASCPQPRKAPADDPSPWASESRLLARPNGQASPPRPSSSRASRSIDVLGTLNRLAEGFIALIVATHSYLEARPARRWLAPALFVAASLLASWWLFPAVEYLPTGNRNLVIGIVLTPPGYNLPELARLGQAVEDALRPYWDVDPDSPQAATLKYPAIADMFFVVRDRQVIVGLRAHDPNRARELVPAVFELRRVMPGSIAVAFQTSLFSRNLQGQRTIDLEIRGPQLTHLVQLGGQILGQVGQVLEPDVTDPQSRTTQARPVPSLDLSSPEVHIVPHPMQAAELGITADELGYTVNALVDGAYVTDFYLQGDKIDLSLVGTPRLSSQTQDLSRLPIAAPGGQLIPLGAVAQIELRSGPEQIQRRERQRAITIQVTPPPAMPLEEAINRIERQIIQPLRDRGQLGTAYQIALGGTADKLRSTWQALRGNLLLALLITYLLMAALFESWFYPLVIILSVPLGVVGGILGLQLLNGYLTLRGEPPQALDVLTMLGFVILIGTVVNNPILIVHQGLHHIREDGMPPSEAILESLRTRIRPIFMTTITTLVGLLPLVLMPGAGSELYRGLGAVVLGGLAVSTFVTLLITPALFLNLMDLRSRWVAWWTGRRGAPPRSTPADKPAAPPPVPLTTA
jgi:HAE1 family hydrophobic/amphiphilic exporter-1